MTDYEHEYECECVLCLTEARERKEAVGKTMSEKKKRVSSSHLALRFYKGDGWTLECLKKYLVKGEFLDSEKQFGDNPDWAYFVLKPYSVLDMKRLYDEQVSNVHRAFNDAPEMSDLQFMESKNW